jgi:hypothetical protein
LEVRFSEKKFKKDDKKSTLSTGTIFISLRPAVGLSNSLDADEIALGAELGRGGFGIVYKATCDRWAGIDLAVKKFHSQVKDKIGKNDNEMSYKNK